MPIADGELTRDFIEVAPDTTVREVRDLAAANPWAYIVSLLSDGQYAVFLLIELIQAMQGWGGGPLWRGMLEALLRDVPGLLEPRASQAVEQARVTADRALERMNKAPGRRLVVLSGGKIAGLLVRERRSAVVVDLKWLDQPELEPEKANGGEGAPSKRNGGGVLSDEAPMPRPPPIEAPEPQPASAQRWINAEVMDHPAAEPLKLGATYTLAFDVDTALREMAVGGGAFEYAHAPGEEVVELTVQLASDDFEIHTEPQKLRVPRTGKSKNKARFDIEPKHEGQGLINAIFLKDGNFIQLITLKLNVGPALPLTPGPSPAGRGVLGRSLEAAFVVRPRDVNLTILNTGAAFQMVLSSQVAATATLRLTLAELEQMIAQARRELQAVVHLEVGTAKTKVYQTGIDIPPEANQAALERLARTGFRLYQRLFYGPAADAQVNRLGDRLRELAAQERLKIQVFSQEFVLPWGILYLAESYDPNQIDPERFLGLKHIIEHIPLQQSMAALGERMDSGVGLAVSLNVNSDLDRPGFPLIANQVSYWERWSRNRGARVTVRRTPQEVTQALADPTTPDQILYFYCHAVSKSLNEGGPSSSSLVLSGNGRLTLEDLNLLAPTRQVLPGSPLVFINACESAELSPLFYDGFVPYFMAKGARGVIGTECETPALFAAEWARRFFDRFLPGQSLGEAVLELRREFYYQHHNVMGLLYAAYCDADTAVAPGISLSP